MSGAPAGRALVWEPGCTWEHSWLQQIYSTQASLTGARPVPRFPPRAAKAAAVDAAAAGGAGVVARAGSGVVTQAARMLDMFGCAMNYNRRG